MAQPWFWGECPGSLAQSKLSVSTTPNGAFLVRFSRQDANFTLSYVHGGRVWHTRVIHSYGSNNYILEGGKTEYNSLAGFVEALKDRQVVRDPCSGWPFEAFFGNTKGQGGCKLRGRHQVCADLTLHCRCRVAAVKNKFTMTGCPLAPLGGGMLLSWKERSIFPLSSLRGPPDLRSRATGLVGRRPQAPAIA